MARIRYGLTRGVSRVGGALRFQKPVLLPVSSHTHACGSDVSSQRLLQHHDYLPVATLPSPFETVSPISFLLRVALVMVLPHINGKVAKGASWEISSMPCAKHFEFQRVGLGWVSAFQGCGIVSVSLLHSGLQEKQDSSWAECSENTASWLRGESCCPKATRHILCLELGFSTLLLPLIWV